MNRFGFMIGTVIALLAPSFAHAAGDQCVGMMQDGHRREAFVCFQKALNAAPHDKQIREHMAQLLAISNKPAEALAMYDAVLKDDPQDRDALESRGALLLMLDRDADAVHAMEVMLKLHPKDAEAISNYGAAALSFGKVDLAQRCFEKSIDIAGPHRNPLMGLGMVEFAKKSPQRAAAYFAEATRVAPSDGDSHAWLGRALATTDTKAAIAELARGAELDPADASIWHDLGQLQLKTSHVRDAGRSFSAAVKLDPNEPKIWIGLGRCRFEFQEYDDAEKALAKGLELKPETPDRADAWFFLGMVREAQKHPKDAEAAYRQQIRTLPSDTRGYIRVGVMQATAHQFKEALATFDGALAADPHCEPALVDRAAMLVELGRFQEARQQLAFFKQVNQNDPALAEILLLHKKIDEKLGKQVAVAARKS